MRMLGRVCGSLGAILSPAAAGVLLPRGRAAAAAPAQPLHEPSPREELVADGANSDGDLGSADVVVSAGTGPGCYGGSRAFGFLVE